MKRNITFLFVLITIFTIYPQSQLKFNRYTTKQGLVNNDVLSINQDKYGFIWLGTKKGISRFDGMKFKNYTGGTGSSNLIGSRWVNVITRDKDDNLWLGLTGNENSFLKYDYKSDQFINERLKFNRALDSAKIEQIEFWSIFADSKGRIWLPEGIRYYNPENGNITTLSESGSARDGIEDNDGNIWLATADIGVVVIKQGTHELLNFRNDVYNPFSLNSNRTYCVFKDSGNDIWIGTKDGLAKFTPPLNNSSEFIQFKHEPNNPNSLSNNVVYDVNEDKNGNLIIATVNGLSVINNKTGIIYQYHTDEIDNESINSNLTRKIFRDKHDNIWVATNQGVGKLQYKNFHSYSQSSYKNSISHNKVQHITEDQNSNIWIATPRGIDVYNRETGLFKFHTGITKNSNGLFGAPLYLHPSQTSGMYVGTWGGGFTYIDVVNKKYINYINNKDASKLSHVFCVYPDKEGRIWISTLDEGVYCYDPQKKSYQNYVHKDSNENSLCDNYVIMINQDSENRMWIGTTKGLSILINKEKGIFENYFENTMINKFVEIDRDNFWVGTGSGLYHFNIQTKESKRYELLTKNENIFGLQHDNSGNLWVSSTEGFVKMTLTEGESYEITQFREEEGMAIGDFLPRSSFKLKDGAMLFGGTKGFCMFHPDKIKKDTLAPAIVLTSLKVTNKTIEINEELNGQIILKQSFINTKELVLNYKNNEFTIEFAGIAYNMPQYFQYAYRLDGHDEKESEWHFTNAENREVKYMNLPEGEYIFKVKAANSYGVWNNVPAELKISILPPWWRTWWFRITLLLVVITGFISFYRYRLNALKRQKRILEQKVIERTSELREANSQLEEKQEEILQQNEELITKNDEIQQQKEELVAKNEEIESSKQKLEKAFNNITILSEFGQKLTATFDFDEINKMIYDYVSSLMDTSAFGIGVYNEKRKIIDFPYFMEKGNPLPYFFKSLSSEKSLSVKCFKNKQEIIINDLPLEYRDYLENLPEVQTSKLPSSIIHLPLTIENKPIGTITVNSFKARAYNDNDVANLRTLASYISIALDNSKAYRIIRSKNEQISGSIRYGQTIQKAMLPPKKQLDNFFENFVIFRPKDIVSGDFYWFATIKNLEGLDGDKQRNLEGLAKGLDSDNSENFAQSPEGLVGDKLGNPQGLRKDFHFLAVVDCTGHGVPGAFMSMIGSRLLNDIVIERKIYSPAKILDQLNTMIRKALRQKTTDNNDGMDVCLCRFQRNGGGWEMTYAGAKRPLIMYNSASNAIEEIHGTRRSIGGFMRRNKIIEFTEENRKLNEGDIFYLSTDGIADQCNPHKRKFSQKRITELLLKIHHKPIHEQKQDIENTLDNFQDGFEQRDDITLVGVKLK